jgi:hypothetical protein
MVDYLGTDWVDRTGNPAYQFQVLNDAATPQAGWGGVGANAPIASYARTMLFNDVSVGGVVKNPRADDIPILYLRSNNGSQIFLLAYNNFTWAIATAAGVYSTFASNLVIRASSAVVQSFGDQAAIDFVGRGNTYIASLNAVEVMRWSDDENIYNGNLNLTHQVAIGYLCSVVQGGWESWQADDLYVWPSLVGNMGDGALSSTVRGYVVVKIGAAFSGGGSMSASASFPVVAEVTTQVTIVGAYTYTIPWWANFVDEIFLGAGGGGAGGSGATAADGNGALAGTYSNRTLVRGSNVPWATTQLTGNIGDGGNPGSQNNAGSGGGPVTRNAISGGDIARQGNPGVGGAGTNGDPGRGAGNLVFNGKTYVGGAQVSSGGNPGAAGLPPGGGGAGGAGGIFNTGKSGGKGGRGQAWFRAYQ